ncbi:MAG: ABC transporter ATP-binding protein [Planctomycetes bacterium]|nr:ABC transporter ATP-binding protein [Planctomycetota bacterium]MBI3834629.1 ABC transporter ATP-binding protein [Planctomycetota bacterium]
MVCEDLRKRYETIGQKPVDALVGLDLTANYGECLGLLGPNGAGKTTTIEILEGLLPSSGGKVEVLGMRWGEHDTQLRNRIGISLQETRLADKLTVIETVRLFSSFYEKQGDADEILQSLSLDEKREARVMTLSGGQKQRLAVACALAGEPELLFLDEPTTGLDPQSRRDVWEIIRRQREGGRTTLLTTHYMDEAERLCDRVAVVDRGKVIAVGSPAELIQRIGGDHVIQFALKNSNDSAESHVELFSKLPSVQACHVEADGFALTVSAPHECIPALVERLGANRLQLGRLTTRNVSLEDVFVSLTGRRLTAEELADKAP